MHSICGIYTDLSTVNLPIFGLAGIIYKFGMSKEILERIEQRLKELDITAAHASRKAGRSADAIRNLQRAEAEGKKSSLTVSMLKDLARALDTTPLWLMSGVHIGNTNNSNENGNGSSTSTLQSAGPEIRYITVKSHVEAGVWSESVEWPEDEWFTVPVPADEKFKNINLYAAVTRGPSMNQVYEEGTVLVYDNMIETQDPYIEGKRYIVERIKPSGEREATVKTLHKDDAGEYWLVPESNDPKFKQPFKASGEDGEEIRIVGRVRYRVSEE